MIIFYNDKKLNKIITFLLFFSILFIGTFSSLSAESKIKPINISELTIPILTYHKFCTGDSTDSYCINISRFEQQMAYLKENGYQVITVSQLVECAEKNNFPHKPIVITIDDGFNSVYKLAYPVLKKFGFPATLFLYTNFIGNGSNQLSWREIREMMHQGIEVGSHTITHCNLLHRKNNEPQKDYLRRIKEEIFLSKSILERNTGSTVISFAYPYGVYSKQIKMLAKQAGYLAQLNVNNMNNTTPIDAHFLNRQVIPAGCSMKQFKVFLHEKTLRVNNVFPPDGTITDNQKIKIGAILNDPYIKPGTLHFSLSGSGSLDYIFTNELQEISFTPVAPKLLQKRTWIAKIAALDKDNNYRKKVSWLFTVK